MINISPALPSHLLCCGGFPASLTGSHHINRGLGAAGQHCGCCSGSATPRTPVPIPAVLQVPRTGGGGQGRGAQSGITGKGGLVVSKRLSSLHPANGKCDVLVWLEVGSVEELSVESE